MAVGRPVGGSLKIKNSNMRINKTSEVRTYTHYGVARAVVIMVEAGIAGVCIYVKARQLRESLDELVDGSV
jgi:DUF2075 family protein